MKETRNDLHGLYESETNIILENSFAVISISKTDANVDLLFDKTSGRDMRDPCRVPFFALENRDGGSIPVTGITRNGNTLAVRTTQGCFDVRICVFERYFTLEITGSIPSGVFRAVMGSTRFCCDVSDKKRSGAVGIAMTTSVDPIDYPDCKSGRTGGAVYPHIGSKGAKYALIIAPVCEQQNIIKEVCLSIDRRFGICSKKGGAWGRDDRINFTNYTIQFESSKDYVERSIPFFKGIGVDQIDFHKGAGTFRQGDFKFMRYENAAGFRKNVTLMLENNGLTAGLHTYSHYIDFDCDEILKSPGNQRQLKVLETFTLAEDVSEESGFIRTVEGTEGVSDDFGFCRTNTPYILIDEEIIRFANNPRGFSVIERGCASTRPACHFKGAAVKHLEGHYFGFTPVLGSKLFYQIARNTAETYNEGGFRSIYLDALDGIFFHCDAQHEAWYYMAEFVRELLLYCDEEPVLEMSSFLPSMWAARGRIGAWDTPYRAYKGFNKAHAESNKQYIERYGAPTLGWYDFYPMTEKYPGNEHTKYHHTDVVEHMGSLAVMYDFGNVFSGTTEEQLARYAGLRRNIGIYKMYDDLRKSQCVTEEIKEKLRNSGFEYALERDSEGRLFFSERSYRRVKLYDLNDPGRNSAVFTNPFGKEQIPFIRIEALLSTDYSSSVTLLELDENTDLVSQPLSRVFEHETDISGRLAKVVRVHGNGIPGGKICIKLRCATNSEEGFGEYIVDTDFEGWREFILLESDNGERCDHGFEKNETLYGVYRSSLNNDRITSISVETEGNMTGVKMSSVTACSHVYEVLKNPTVSIGDTEVMFECELMSSDFIEFDGKDANVTDRYGNSKKVWFRSDLKSPGNDFNVRVKAAALNRCVPRCILTVGLKGEAVR